MELEYKHSDRKIVFTITFHVCKIIKNIINKSIDVLLEMFKIEMNHNKIQ